MINIELKTILDINMILSLPCIVIIIIVYTWLPELRNIHGKCLICYLIFLGSSNILTIIGEKRIGRTTYVYIYVGLVICMMQWIHVTTFDIWRNLKRLRWNANRRLSEGKRFCLYALYACSTPFLLYGLLNLIPNKEIALKTVYTFVISLSTINIILFVLTIWNIFRTNQEVIVRGENQRFVDRFNVERQRFVLYFRMFIVTGIVTSIAIFSNFYFDNDTLSQVLDVFLSLEPILLFILLILKRSTRDKILKRWQGKTNKTDNVRALNHRNATPSNSWTVRTGSTDI